MCGPGVALQFNQSTQLLTGTTCCEKNVLPTSLTSNDQQNAWWTGPGCGDQ